MFKELFYQRHRKPTCFPSMQAFFYICEYFGISPAEFFDANSRYPLKYQEIIWDLNTLDPKNLEHIKAIIKALQH